MARTADREAQKSDKLHFRVTPDLKAKLQLEADRNNRLLSAECEHRLWESMEESDARASDDTKRLLHAIKLNIFEIEQATGGSWKSDVATWTAVRDMLFWGPINELKITNKALLQDLEANSEKRAQITADKQRIIDVLAMLGVTATLAPQRPSILGLLSGLAPQGPGAPRDDVRHAVEATEGLSDEHRTKALELVDLLADLDAQEQENDEKRAAIIAPIKEKIEEGRATYERPRLPEALNLALELLLFEAIPPRPTPRPPLGMFGAKPALGTAR